MAFALTDEGLTTQTTEEIRAELDADCKSRLGPQVNTTDGAVLGIYNGIMAERFATLQEGVQAVNSSQNPDTATGAALAALAALTGTVPNAATKGTVTLTLTGDPTTVVAEGSVASTIETEDRWETDAEATITALTAWASGTVYALGDRRTNADRAYVCIGAGTSAGSGGPTTDAASISDNTALWRYIGEGTGAIDVAATAEETGPIVATSGSITNIETEVSGWSSVRNLEDADPGTDAETDEDLRVRRESELQAAGTSPQEAIRVDLAEVADVTAVRVFMNVTDTTDGDGVPPHSVEALVAGGTDQAIWDKLLISVAAGIRTHGTESGTSVDSEGVSQTMKFSRPDPIEIYVIANVVKDPDLFPADGEDQIKAAIVAYGLAQTTGKNAVSSALVAQVFAITGVLEVTSLYIGTAPAPGSSATIAISLRELAEYDTSRITVNVSDGTP
jgi:uncharacterized phage protein gp47/JayE